MWIDNPAHHPPVWRFSLEDVGTGARSGFADLDALIHHLLELMEPLPDRTPEDEAISQQMNGGRAKWLAEGRAISTEPPQTEPVIYTIGMIHKDLRALRPFVEESIGHRERAIVDVRSPDEFSGKLLAPANLPQEGSQRGGHIPGAANIPWATAVREDGCFKSRAELEQIYGAKGVTGDKQSACRLRGRS